MSPSKAFDAYLLKEDGSIETIEFIDDDYLFEAVLEMELNVPDTILLDFYLTPRHIIIYNTMALALEHRRNGHATSLLAKEGKKCPVYGDVILIPSRFIRKLIEAGHEKK